MAKKTTEEALQQVAEVDPVYAAISLAKEIKLDDPELREHSELDAYKLFREHLPIARLESSGTQTAPMLEGHPSWLFTRYEDCKFVLQRTDLFSSDVQLNKVLSGGEYDLRIIPQSIDPPEQQLYRKLLDPFFTPARMEKLEPEIEHYAAELLDPIIERGECDFLAEFAIPFPTIIFCKLMGFPVEDHPMLMDAVQILLHGGSPGTADMLGWPAEARDEHGVPLHDFVEDDERDGGRVDGVLH
jgi:cytochrome P450